MWEASNFSRNRFIPNGLLVKINPTSNGRCSQRAKNDRTGNEHVFQKGKRATKPDAPKRSPFRCVFAKAVQSKIRLAEPWNGLYRYRASVQ
jgi:hypothetical protein